MELPKQELEHMLAQQADRVAQESDERMKVYIGGLKEDFDSKLDTIMEYVADIPAIKEKQEVMFDTIGEIAEDVTILKEAVKDHAVRLQRLEAR